MTATAAPRGVIGPAVLSGAGRAGRALGSALVFVGLFLRGRRKLTLPGLASTACFSAAGYTVSITAGLVVTAVMLLIIDWRLVGDGGG